VLFRRRNNDNIEKADEALKEAEETLERVKSRAVEVRSVAQSLRRIRERNHFGEQLEEMFLQSKG
jgi:predicted nuclease with TOPRIM domain